MSEQEQESYQPVGGEAAPVPAADPNLPEANPLEAAQAVPAPEPAPATPEPVDPAPVPEAPEASPDAEPTEGV